MSIRSKQAIHIWLNKIEPMNVLKRTYRSPVVEKVLMDNDISLALESPWGNPNLIGTLDFGTELTPTETLMPIL